jgi:predicted ATPase/DNA-binding SARP family transcriptional activator
VTIDSGDEVHLRPQTRRLVALLLAAEGQPVSADRIADVLGLAAPDGSGFRMVLSRLRSIVGERLETTSSGYRLVAGDHELDVRAFETAVRPARTAGPAERVERLVAALGFWRGDCYGEFADEPWAMAVATRLTQARLAVIEDLAAAMIADDNPSEAALLLQANAGALLYRERAAALLMESLAASGRVTDALRAYQEFRGSLARDIGIEPTKVLRQLEAELLADDAVRPFRPRAAFRRATHAGNLTEPLSSFVGRESELGKLVADLGPHRLVSLVGPGGVGKTRLAIAAARFMAASFPDGLWFVDLAPLRTVEAVAAATASTLGVAGVHEDRLLEAVVDLMSRRTALVIVDNCEHVLAGAEAVVGALVANCPSVRVLVTSREALGVPGECISVLGPLDLHDSVELFRVRAEEATRRVDRVGSDSESITRICRHVDGMPLSIELAATRMRSSTPSEVLERLERLGLDDIPTRGRPDRQRTMRAMVDWSYRLLTSEERWFFDRLSVFAGSFDAAAATAVAAFDPIAPDDTAELLAALVDKSMVIADVGGRTSRYRLLDVMRHFGHDQIVERDANSGSTERGRLFARHARHYESVARTVSELFPTNASEAISLLDDHWDNWRVAVSRLIDAGDVRPAARIVAFLWPTMITFRTEIAAWVAAVRERMAADDPCAPWIHEAAAQWALVFGDCAQAIDIASAGVAVGPPTSNALWTIIAEAQTITGNVEAGFAAALASLDGSAGHGGEGAILAAACRSAWAFEPSEVRPWAERLCVLAAANGRIDDRARAAHAMGIASLVDDDPAAALAWFNEGREAARGLRGLEAEALQGVARATALLDGADVEAAFLEALTVLYQDLNWMYAWVALENLMLAWVAHRRSEDAALLLGHLEAHGRASAINAPRRREAVEAMGTDGQLAIFRQRGATMSPIEIIEYAIDRLADSSSRAGRRPVG